MKRFILNHTKLVILFLLTLTSQISANQPVEIEKAFLYNIHTLDDDYLYQKTTRQFQWDKIRNYLVLIESIQAVSVDWGILQNYKNQKGQAPLVKNHSTNEYKRPIDAFNNEQSQGIPLYFNDVIIPERYGLDGELVKILEKHDDFIKIKSMTLNSEWMVPQQYVHPLKEGTIFKKAVFVDRTNQNITTLEHIDKKWLIRSMNPATTGLHKPPYKMPTPIGIFVIQEKKERMLYYKDGTTRIEGFAPYASRFSSGAYLHGIPVSLPHTRLIEFSTILGTTPRSHKCVRNATSHALFLYDWAPIEEALVFIFD